MAQKCVHKGCGKEFTDPSEPCTYHPGPPVFHEGKKGWECCKPRVLSFDEFLSILPCTTGTHSTVDDTPPPPTSKGTSNASPTTNTSTPTPTPSVVPRKPMAIPQTTRTPEPPAPPESDSDDASARPTAGSTCKRRGCGAEYKPSGDGTRGEESCTYHPGAPLFHEGTKGWTCCKRRVLEFDEFLKIPGCKTRSRHCFVGKKGVGNGQGKSGSGAGATWQDLETVRHDFYQTPSTVTASLYLKGIDKTQSQVEFASPSTVKLDLRTADHKRYITTLPLFTEIKPSESSFSILGSRLELLLAKADPSIGWPVLRSDERSSGKIIQSGKHGVLT